MAEADEVFMANFGHGWDCGASTGEGLSRVLANAIYRGVEPANFISSSVWLSLKARPLKFQLKYTWAKIIGAGGATDNPFPL